MLFKKRKKSMRKEKVRSQWEKKNGEKLDFILFNRLFYEALKIGN